jgi:non-ribosomal peptide synthase protein (TIGR01720 family)
VPSKGIGYGVIRYLMEQEDERGSVRGEEAEISFNYLGQFDQVLEEGGRFRRAQESVGASSSEQEAERGKRLEVVGGVMGGRLEMRMRSGGVRGERLEELGRMYEEEMEGIIRHCEEDGAGGYTPSDFEMSGMSQQELDEVIGSERGIEDIYVLSPLQQGMLFHSLYEPGSGEYYVQTSWGLEGRLEEEALRRGWERVIERHTILRTSFITEGVSEPVQVVRREVEMEWKVEDWRGLEREEQEKEMERYMEEDRKRGFDLRRAPLMRVAVIREGEEVSRVVWSFHHLLLDGWSVSMLMKEVFSEYEAEMRGVRAEAGARRAYGEYIEWLRRQDLGKAERYWREKLRGMRGPTQMKVERGRRRRKQEQEKGKAEVEVRVSREVSEGLVRMARQQQVTVNTVVQGAWAILMSRYSGEEDVVFGAVVSGRPAEMEGVEKMLGMFINTLPVRVRVRGEERVSEWLRRMQEGAAEMREYEYSPLVKVQGWSEAV